MQAIITIREGQEADTYSMDCVDAEFDFGTRNQAVAFTFRGHPSPLRQPEDLHHVPQAALAKALDERDEMRRERDAARNDSRNYLAAATARGQERDAALAERDPDRKAREKAERERDLAKESRDNWHTAYHALVKESRTELEAERDARKKAQTERDSAKYVAKFWQDKYDAQTAERNKLSKQLAEAKTAPKAGLDGRKLAAWVADGMPYKNDEVANTFGIGTPEHRLAWDILQTEGKHIDEHRKKLRDELADALKECDEWNAKFQSQVAISEAAKADKQTYKQLYQSAEQECTGLKHQNRKLTDQLAAANRRLDSTPPTIYFHSTPPTIYGHHLASFGV